MFYIALDIVFYPLLAAALLLFPLFAALLFAYAEKYYASKRHQVLRIRVILIFTFMISWGLLILYIPLAFFL